jgi:hypothetical protein
LIDHAFYLTMHRRPRSARVSIVRLAATKSLDLCMSAWGVHFNLSGNSFFCSRRLSTRNLSDHFPLVAQFRF